jgi:hypothetical protein
MSRFVRTAGQAASGVDLSTCTISTTKNITTTCTVSASNYCGSGKTLCDNRWDLVCCFTNISCKCTGCIGSSLRIELPTHCYSEFDFYMEGLCLTCGALCLYFSNSTCACTCANIGWLGCCLVVDACAILGFNPIPSGQCAQGILVTGNSAVNCCNCISFGLILQKRIPDNGINICYCTYQCSACYICQECRATVCGTCSINLAWNCCCACTCRFTSIVLCTPSFSICYSPSLSFRLYGRKDNYTCYATLG